MQDKFDPYKILDEIDFTGLKKNPPILIAARFWEKDRFEAAKVCYQFMRKIDDLVDDRKTDLSSITDCEKKLFEDKINDWISCLNGSTINDPLLDEVYKVVSDYKIPLDQFQVFARSMIYDINHNNFPTFDSFLKYADGASVAPASVFVHLCCWSDDLNSYVMPGMDLTAVARPCSIFSYLVHIIRDFQLDQKSNLNYFADEILRKNNLSINDLLEIANGGIIPVNFRRMIKEYINHARIYEKETEKTIGKLSPFLSPRYLLSLEIIFKLYKQVFERINVNNVSFSAEELNPSPTEMKDCVVEVIENERSIWNSKKTINISAA